MNIKRNFTFLLSVLFLLNLSFSVDANIETRDYVPRKVNIDRSPKNILFGTFFGGRSHNKPMLDIGAILIERGYNVVLATSGNYTPSSEYPTVKQISLGPNLDLKHIKNVEKFIEDGLDFNTMQDLIVKRYNNTFEIYKNAAKDYNIDLFVCYALMNDACVDAARALKKPIVGFAAFLHALEPKSYKSDPVFKCKISLENESLLERFRCTIIEPIRMIYYLNSFMNQLNDIRKQINVEPVVMSTSRLSKTSLILADNFFGFELPQSLPPNIQEIGPVLSEEYPPLSPKLSDFMVRHKRVLYIAFGARFFTTTKTNSKLLQSFIEAINKNIIDGVIWSLAQTSKDNFPPALSLTDGTQIQTSSILNNEHPHIHIETKFAPQFAILNHTNTKLFLSHGGVGSSHESLYTGTPMLILPFAGDQMGNAEKLKLSGVALTLNKHDLDVIDIINKVDYLLKDENVKKNVKRLEILAKINSKRKYRAADLIEYVLHSNESVDDEEFLKEWIPADNRMGIIRGNNYDVLGALLGIILGFIGGILWFTLKSIRFIVRKISSSANSKPKRE